MSATPVIADEEGHDGEQTSAPHQIAEQACHQGPEHRASGADGEEEPDLEQTEPL